MKQLHYKLLLDWPLMPSCTNGRQWRLTLMIQPCMQRGAFAGFIWVKKTRLWMMHIPTELWRWIYQIPAMSKQQLSCWWRSAVAGRVCIGILFPILCRIPWPGHALMLACLGVCPSMQNTCIGIETGPEKRQSGLKFDHRSAPSDDAAGWRNLVILFSFL